ncbi:MAG TPA: dihydroxyacetone kinase subunit DhaK, partial [Nakamurella sp.]
MKKIINDPTTVVTEALEGMALAHPDLIKVTLDPAFIVRADAPVSGKVALVSGGGSGHEPLHGGFVGAGMLDAAAPGAVFTSPTPDQVLAATQAVDGGAGVLHIIKNYTGDVLNFETAAELAAAEDIEVSSVVVDDDVAVKDSTWTAGRRGVGGTVLLEKIAGAAAARGDDLAAVTAIARRLNAQARTMGMALTPCTVPHSGEPSFTLAEDEMEIGIGIHGEPGRERVKLAPADEIVATLLGSVVDDLPFADGDNTLLFVNGMGGTPQIELYLAYNSARKFL